MARNRWVVCGLALWVAATVASAQSFTVQGNQVSCGAARFDVLAPDLVRMQWTEGPAVDEPTAVVTNRELSDTNYAAQERDGWLCIGTPQLQVRYRVGSGRFTSENLRADWSDAQGYHEWYPGATDEANLGGPVSSFNAIIEDTLPERTLPRFPQGFLSKAGCWLLDDSRTPVWDPETQWIKPRAAGVTQDWYLFVYGRDFGRFLERYQELAGKVPMIPRYALGAWVTDLNFEYSNQQVTEQDLFTIVDRFRAEQIPLDVFVLDFGWHPYGWGGSLDWSPFIPDPKAFLSRMEAEGIRVSANDHPSSGLDGRDSRVADARRELGLPTPEERLLVDLDAGWRMKDDPRNQGQREGWEKPEFDDAGWKLMPGPGAWEDMGLPGYDGYVWYRQKVDLSERFSGKPVYACFGGVDDEYDLYVNGSLVKHWGAAGDSVYDKRTVTDITAYVTVPGPNVIALRVLDWGNFGGILKPAMLLPDLRMQDTNVYFNMADKQQAELYMRYHNEVVDQGLDFWWIDGDYARMDGLDSQMWTNRVYYDYQAAHTGERSLIFSRYGGPGSHRYPGFFTADCFSNWKTLAWEIPYTLKSGNVLVPYVTHDVGGFIGPLKDDFELYARWIQFGALSPLLRLHSAHENPGEGNARLPWTYGGKGIALARQFFQLRYSLIPYLYTYCREAYDTGMPLCRALYLEFPDEPAAYECFDEYLLGRELLVAPITSPAAGDQAARSIWFPPGQWLDVFTGESYPGGTKARYSCGLDRMPLFVRQGSIIPRQQPMAHTDERPVDPLIVDVYPGAAASFSLYEDDGMSMGYTRDEFRRTRLELREANGSREVEIGVPQGQYKGMTPRKRYEVRLHTAQAPARATVNGAEAPLRWDASLQAAIVEVAVGDSTGPWVVAFE